MIFKRRKCYWVILKPGPESFSYRIEHAHHPHVSNVEFALRESFGDLEYANTIGILIATSAGNAREYNRMLEHDEKIILQE